MSKKFKTKPKPTQMVKKKGMVTIPYVKGTSEALQIIFNKYNVATTMRPLSKLRGMLVHPKDKGSLEDSTGVVYQIPCKDCDKVYVGEKSRKFRVKKAEHKQEAATLLKTHFTRSNRKEAETAINKSAINDHVAKENHTIGWKKSKILSKDSNTFTTWIREAIHIQRGQERTMNRFMGQLQLSSTYIPILSDRKAADTPSTASQRQSDEACSKRQAKAHKVITNF